MAVFMYGQNTISLTFPSLSTFIKIMDNSNIPLWTIPKFDMGGFLTIVFEIPKTKFQKDIDSLQSATCPYLNG